jgi:PAS domain S-box-containing protein
MMKQSNDAIRTSERESEEKYKMITQSSLDIIFIVDIFGKQLFFNESVEKVLGYKVEETIGRSFTEFVPKSEWLNYFSQLKNVFSHNQIINFITKIYHKDGHLVDVEINGKLVKQGGEYVGQGTIRDITERKRAEAEIKLKNEQLVKLIAEKDKFFSIIAHDLRSPFYSFLGLTQMMTEDLPHLTMDQIREIAGTMRNSAANLFRLLENLLHWSLMQQGLIPFNPEILQLHAILEESLEMNMESANEKGIRISYDIPADIEVYADTIMFQTIMRNLVSNAVKFTRNGGKIILSARASKHDGIKIAVKDSGIGMNRIIINNLFQLDVQTNREGTDGEPSTGLGLLLCKEFIERHGGKIKIKSQENKGSVFSFTLPSFKQ